MRINRFFLLPVLFVAACGGATPDAKEPVPAASAAPEAASSASPSAAPAKQSIDADDADGARRWAAWDGPKSGAQVTTPRAWVIAPNTMSAGSDKLSFGSVHLRLVTVEKAGAEEVLFTDRNHKYAVPAALAWPVEAPKGLAKGAAVRCSFGGNTTVARVDTADAKSVTCAFRFMDATRRAKMPLTDVRRLSGKVEPGAPVVVHFGSDSSSHYLGMVVASAEDAVWVKVDTTFADGDARAGRAVHKLKPASVEVIDLSKPLKVGDACLATDISTLVPCKVSKVVEGGLAYVVEFEGGAAGGRKEWSFDEVVPVKK
ncbi:hypothetical protein A7982_12559 [Minicystis rosea]|nr:hypothetical protein A7982_12559 [Minicystis rosea]